MKKSKIFLASATAVLAIVAVFASKANKRFFTQVNTAYLAGATTWYLDGAGSFLTTKGSVQVRLNLYYTSTVAGVTTLNPVSGLSGVGGDLIEKASPNHPAMYK